MTTNNYMSTIWHSDTCCVLKYTIILNSKEILHVVTKVSFYLLYEAFYSSLFYFIIIISVLFYFIL